MDTKITTDHQIQTAIGKGYTAAQLLNDPMLKDAFERIEKQATESMVNAEDASKREMFWYRIQAIRALRQELETIVTSGKMAARKKETFRG